MPWKIYQNCVHKENADGGKGELVPGGCHKTHSEAVAHLRALYASEAKEITDDTLSALKEIVEDGDEEKAERASAILDEWKARIGEIPSEEPEEQGEDDAEEKEYAEEAEKLPAAYTMAKSFTELESERDLRERSNDLSALVNDFQGMVSNILYGYFENGNDRIPALENLFSEFKERAQSLINGEIEDKELDEEKAKRADVSAADRKRAVAKYGDVTYADETNKKYPLDTEEHIRAAWNYIRMPKNSKKYSDNGAAIKRKIIAAWKKKIDPKGPPAAQKKDLLDKLKDIGDAIKSWFKNEPEDETGLSIWKEGNTYWWMARYSNKFRDNDYPPEIISSDSHKRFVELVKEGKAPLPELWSWHKKNWKVGKAHSVAYDDTGFAVAIGTFDVGKESVAEALMNTKEPIRLSHGMPISSIKRDEVDPTIIVEHETREISFLPAWAAANKLTGFVVLTPESKEESMAIPDETKKEWVENLGIDPKTLEGLEAANAEDAAKALNEGLESKETEEAQPATQEPEVVEPESLTVDQLREAVQEAVKGIVAPVIERMDAIEAGMKEIKEASDKRDKALEGTPTASLSALLGQFAQSAIGAPETRVDGRTSLAQSKPKETAAEGNGRTGIPFVDQMLAGNQ